MLWEEILEKAQRIDTQRNNIFQEEMQKAVLTALSQNGCFNNIVFKGGTALRLFYGNPRFSEDIDLVLNEGEKEFDLKDQIPNIKRFCFHSFPFLDSINIKTQKDEAGLQRFILQSSSGNSEQKLRLHIELVSIPSYLNEPRILDFPPIHPAVRVEDAIEILADKVCAIAFRSYLKGRDLWDIYFLTKERSVELQWDLVRKKIEDYQYLTSELTERLQKARMRILDDGESVLENELTRFLPYKLMDNYRSNLGTILDTVSNLISDFSDKKGAASHES